MNNEKIFNKAVKIIKSGGIIAHATETCYGFACDIYNKKAIEKLYKLKKMQNTKPISIMVSSLVMAKKYGFFNKKAKALAGKYWSGPLTIIVKRKKTLPIFLNPEMKTIGIRMPDNAFCQNLIKRIKHPLSTTSANISGKSSPYSVLEISRQFHFQELKPDLIVDAGRLKRNLPSTIVDVSNGETEVKREGKIKIR